MQKVISVCLSLIAIFFSCTSLFSQEAFAPDQLYFQGEVIRKVSVGSDGVWVIKGEDSTGLARLDFQGGVRDYSAALGLNQPLTGILGKYGEHALFLSKEKQLFSLNNNTVSRLDQAHGITALRINDIYGSPGHTRIATEKGVFESYDNLQFNYVTNSLPTSGQDPECIELGGSTPHFVDVHKTNNYSTFEEAIIVNLRTAPESTRFPYNVVINAKGFKGINCIKARDTDNPISIEIFVGGKSGLHVEASDIDENDTYSIPRKLYAFLPDTTVYAVENYQNFDQKSYTLIGSENGLYHYTNTTHKAYNGKVTPINLNGEFIIYDIAVQQEEQVIWLATDKGLLKLIDNYKTVTSYENNSLLWAKSFEGKEREKVNSTITDKEGNIYQTGYFESFINFGNLTLTAKNSKDYFLAKLNKQGEVQWVRTAENNSIDGKRLNEEGYRLSTDSKGNVYVLCNTSNPQSTAASYIFDDGFGLSSTTSSKQLLLKYNSAGELLWMKELAGLSNPKITQLGVDEQDILYFSSDLEEINPFNLPAGRGVIKFDENGNQIWGKSFPSELSKLNLGKGGNFYLSGYFKRTLQVDTISFTSTLDGNLAIILFDNRGKPVWANQITGYSWSSDGLYIREIQSDAAGNTYLGGATYSDSYFDSFTTKDDFATGNGATHYFLAKLNIYGKYEWLRYNHGNPYYASFKDLVVDSDGNSFITGMYGHASIKFGENFINYERDGNYDKHNKVYIAKFDKEGNNLWAHALSEVRYYEYESIDKSLAITQEGILVAATQVSDVRLNSTLYDKQGEVNIFLAEISNTFIETPFYIIKGKSFHDLNANNKFDEGEIGIKSNIIKAEPGPVYATTNYNGDYELKLGAGNYTVEQVIPGYTTKIITQTFPTEAYAVQVDSQNSGKNDYDYAHQVEYIRQPYKLNFDISSAQFRRCFTSTTTVHVSNRGDIPAEYLDVVVEYPDHLIPLSSNIPWIKKENNLLTFRINSIAPNTSSIISIKDSVACGDESIRNLQQCIKAYLNYTDPAKVDPKWDQSDIELAAECKDNGFVRVNVKNSGTGAMADSANFKIFIDQALIYSGRYKLAAGENLSLNLLTNGKPLLFMADLSPHHPHKKTVSISVDGCNTSAGPAIASQLEHNFPADPPYENLKIVCLPIVDSFDPNDKQVVPAGITANHNIKGDEYLEYTIRFQNTGTASAINIRITDELDERLDLSSLKIGAASHPMVWEKQTGSNTTLVWRFININLPDSTTNEPGSHGFVKFRIKPKQGLSKGTVIKNKADIYFDYNSPIETNEVFNTIGLPELMAGEKMVIQNCNTRIDLQQEQNIELILCGNTSYKLSRLATLAGSGLWKVSRGSAVVENPFNHETMATNLSYGENEFIWEVTYCDQKVSSKITIIREQALEQPAVAASVAICEGDPINSITATGEGIEWYRDAALTEMVLKGNSYLPTAQASEVLYVIQRNERCTSLPATVSIDVHTPPHTPIANAVEACIEVTAPVFLAQGSSLRWYADAQKQQLLAEGDTFSPTDKSSSKYYVTQSSEFCESQPLEVSFTAKRFDPSKASIANVVTPNGDDKNQLYYIRDFESKECLGDFIAINIFNRWGNKVYESKKADFQWDASQLPSGVYYYQLHYQLLPFYGYIQVIK